MRSDDATVDDQHDDVASRYRVGNKNPRNLYVVAGDGSETHIGCVFEWQFGPVVVAALNAHTVEPAPAPVSNEDDDLMDNDSVDQPDGIDEQSRDLPDPTKGAERIRSYLSEWGDGRIDKCGGQALYARDLEAVARAVLEPAPAPVVGDLRERLIARWHDPKLCGPCDGQEGVACRVANEAEVFTDFALSVVGPELAAKDAEIARLVTVVGEKNDWWEGEYNRAESLSRRAAKRKAERDKARAEVGRLHNALADCVSRCTEFGTQDGGFVANYILPTGPIHRAIPILDAAGIPARPGFDPRMSHPPAASPSPVEAQPAKVSLEDLVMPADPFEAAKRAYYAWSRSMIVGPEAGESWEDHCRTYPAAGEAWVAVAVAVLEGVPLPAPTNSKLRQVPPRLGGTADDPVLRIDTGSCRGPLGCTSTTNIHRTDCLKVVRPQAQCADHNPHGAHHPGPDYWCPGVPGPRPTPVPVRSDVITPHGRMTVLGPRPFGQDPEPACPEEGSGTSEAQSSVATGQVDAVSSVEPEQGTRTLTVSWHPDAIQRAIRHAKRLLDEFEPDVAVAGPLTWTDLACLVDAGRAIATEAADEPPTPSELPATPSLGVEPEEVSDAEAISSIRETHGLFGAVLATQALEAEPDRWADANDSNPRWREHYANHTGSAPDCIWCPDSPPAVPVQAEPRQPRVWELMHWGAFIRFEPRPDGFFAVSVGQDDGTAAKTSASMSDLRSLAEWLTEVVEAPAGQDGE